MRAQSRRTDAFPTTWEIPVGIGLIWVLGSLLAFPAGQGIAYALQGDGFVWPAARLGPSLLGLLSGDPGRGLSSGLRADIPHMAVIYGAIVVVEVALAAAALFGLLGWWRTVGPLAQFGMATRHEVTAVLGRSKLKRRCRTIRPDLASGRRS